MKETFKEHDVVTYEGQIGTIIHLYNNHPVAVVEFNNGIKDIGLESIKKKT